MTRDSHLPRLRRGTSRPLSRSGAPKAARRAHDDEPAVNQTFETQRAATTDLGTIELQPAATVCLHVMDAAGKRTPATVEVHFLDVVEGSDRGRHWNGVQTDAHGAVDFKNLSSGQYLLTAWNEQAGFARVETRVVAGSNSEVALRLSPAVAFTLSPARDQGFFKVRKPLSVRAWMVVVDASGEAMPRVCALIGSLNGCRCLTHVVTEGLAQARNGSE